MSQKVGFIPLWTQEVPSICRFCAFANPITATEDVYCEKKKEVLLEDSTCKKFRYDILKKDVRRVRKRAKDLNPAQFEI